MSEIDLVRSLQIKASELGHRLWRNNSGVGWAGQQIRVSRSQMVMIHPGDVVIRAARALHAGLATGSSDLIGITNTGRFLAVEAKTPKGRTTDGQESFLEMVNRLGGIGIVARSLEDFNV
jgi:hypothetical protein